jgi:acyl carrier protein
MDELEVRVMVAEILEAEPSELQETTELESFKNYDSVARLSLMVGLSDFTGRPVTVEELMELCTYGDVMRLAKTGLGNGHNQ